MPTTNKAQADLNRYTPLVEKDVISKLQYDAAVAAAKSNAAALADAQASEQAAEDGMRVAREREAQAQASQKYALTGPQQVAAQTARYKQAQAQVEQAQAALDQAKLNLGYTKIVAPEDGIITRKSVEINQNVSPGQNLLTLVSLRGFVGDGELQGDAAQAHAGRARKSTSMWTPRARTTAAR